jgi:hypothetical protein
MAELTPLDEKLAEVLGLAQAAQAAADTVAKMEDAEGFSGELSRMRDQAAETERRTDALVDGLDGKKTAIRDIGARDQERGHGDDGDLPRRRGGGARWL